jgi:hypothetical protein
MLVREYGAGTFAGWLQLIEPFNPSWTFVERADEQCRMLRAQQSKAPHLYPKWPLWPSPGGFLPWGTTVDGDSVGWRTEGRPEAWTVLFWAHGGTGSGEYDTGAVDFLVELVEDSQRYQFTPATS